jgi:uncharacterized protein YkwD
VRSINTLFLFAITAVVLSCTSQAALADPAAALAGLSTHTPRGLSLVKAPRASRPGRASGIARILTTQCQYTDLMPEPGNLEEIHSAVLCLVNKKRAESGETPLRLSGQLERAAEGHGREMISEDYFGHVSPSGETPVDRIRTTGYIPGGLVGYVIGENLAWGTLGLATPRAIVEAWIASPGHLANILEGSYRQTGIGVAPNAPAALDGGEPGATYVQDFGVIVR